MMGRYGGELIRNMVFRSMATYEKSSTAFAMDFRTCPKISGMALRSAWSVDCSSELLFF